MKGKEVKPGWQTSEAWATAAVIAPMVADAVMSQGNHWWSAIAAAAASGIYSMARAKTKVESGA